MSDYPKGWEDGRDAAAAKAREMANELSDGKKFFDLPSYMQTIVSATRDVANAIEGLTPPAAVPASAFCHKGDPPDPAPPFRVIVTRAEEVVDHPLLGSWSSVTTPEGVASVPKLIGEHRYAVGDLVVFVPKGSLVHGKLLRLEGYVNSAPGQVDRRHIVACNILLPTFVNDNSGIVSVQLYGGKAFPVREGDDVAKLLLIERAPHAT